MDDHQLFVAGLTSLINAADDLVVCGTASEATRALLEIPALRPDLVILDYRLRDTDGIAVAAALRRVMADVPILFLSSLADPATRKAAQQLGARGFLEKTQEPDRILHGIHRALAN